MDLAGGVVGAGVEEVGPLVGVFAVGGDEGLTLLVMFTLGFAKDHYSASTR
jgi:hypothetical protein